MSDAKRLKVDGDPPRETRTYTAKRVLGKGSFGVVYLAQALETNELFAIKSVLWTEAHRGSAATELQILKELDGHPNVVSLKGSFISNESGETRLNLVLEFMPDTLHRVIKHYNVLGKHMDVQYYRLYCYQMLRSLAFIHGRGIVHADIKPQNFVLQGRTHTLKLCDFGTAKRLAEKQPRRFYVCSRFYRAPEVVLGSTTWSTSIDLWSAGCVFAEMIIGQPLFQGAQGVDQFTQMVEVLGTPSAAELQAMNPNYPAYEFSPKLERIPWSKVFNDRAPEDATDLADNLMRYHPRTRIPPLPALAHRFFDVLRAEPDDSKLKLFRFREDELWFADAQVRKKLIPPWAARKPKA